MPATTASDEVTDLGAVTPAEVLAAVVDAEAAERRAGLAKLELGLEWCLMHPATEESGVAVWGDAGIPGTSGWEDTLGGQGAPLVAYLAAEPFAAALGVSAYTGMQLLADALDLAYRLPATWAKTRAGDVTPWKARRLAQATHRLSQPAAAYVDAQLADRIDSCGAVLIDQAVTHAAAKFDPATQQAKETTAHHTWDVRLTHPTAQVGGFTGTSYLEAVGDTIDLTAFYTLVCDHAAALARLGDTDHLGARKAKALGLIATTQPTLDLTPLDHTNTDHTTTDRADSEQSEDPPKHDEQHDEQHDQQHAEQTVPPGDRQGVGLVRQPRPRVTQTRLYLHLTGADLLDPLQPLGPLGPLGVGEVEGLGPATTTKIKDWLGTTRATIVPVLHLDSDHPDNAGRPDHPERAERAVDVHDPPPSIRETVIVRDRHCVFPWCRRDARRCDVDHITPYQPLDQGGPPGQTSPANLAPLCRRHHNAKTSRLWSYARNRDGTYTWHSPHGATYLVTPQGTQTLTHP